MPKKVKELPKHEKELPKKNYFRFAYLVAAYIPVLLPVTGLLRVLLYLFLFAATSYYIINLFSRLTGVNMFSAYAWSLHSSSSKPYFLFPLGAGVCFTIAFIVMIVLLRLPAQVEDMKNDNIAGLMGYQDSTNMLWLYDPLHGSYVSCNNYSPEAVPEKFTDLFRIVLLYKAPGDRFYFNTEFIELSANIGRLVLIVLFLVPIYFLLYYFTVFYIERNGLDMGLSHYLMLTRYRDILGMHPALAGILALALMLAVPVYGNMSVKKLINRYMNTYGVHRERLKKEIMNKVSPGAVIKGSVILRRVNIESTETTDTGSKYRQRTYSHSATYNYTVRFGNLVEIPVYLKFTLDYGDEQTKRLEKAFKDQKTVAPESIMDYDFIVNDDYSVSLK